MKHHMKITTFMIVGMVIGACLWVAFLRWLL
jgi:hypothetical protein